MKIKYCFSSGKKIFAAIILAAPLIAATSPGDIFCAGLTIGDALLKMPVSAESAGLGTVKIFDKRYLGNPAYAALAISTGTADISFGYSSTALGVRIFELGGLIRRGRFATGLNFYQQNAGNADIHRLPFEDVVEELIFTKNLQTDNVLSLTGGYGFTQNFSIGLAARYLNSKILDEYELSSLSFDAGFAFSLRLIGRRLLVSGMASNMGEGGNYLGPGASSEKFPLPLTYSAGVSYSLFNFADIIFFRDYLEPESKISYGYAAEFYFPDERVYPLNTVRLRLGWRMPYSDRGGGVENAAIGFSMGFSQYLLDYAFAPLDNAGFTHRLGFTYRFSHRPTIPARNIVESARIIFIDGKFEEKTFTKLEDIAQMLKEKPTYLVRVEGALENVEKVMDYFVNNERLPESLFVVSEQETEWVDVILIKK